MQFEMKVVLCNFPRANLIGKESSFITFSEEDIPRVSDVASFERRWSGLVTSQSSLPIM